MEPQNRNVRTRPDPVRGQSAVFRARNRRAARLCAKAGFSAAYTPSTARAKRYTATTTAAYPNAGLEMAPDSGQGIRICRGKKVEGLTSCRGFKDWFIEKYDRPGFTIEIGRGSKMRCPLEQFPEIYRKLRAALDSRKAARSLIFPELRRSIHIVHDPAAQNQAVKQSDIPVKGWTHGRGNCSRKMRAGPAELRTRPFSAPTERGGACGGAEGQGYMLRNSDERIPCLRGRSGGLHVRRRIRRQRTCSGLRGRQGQQRLPAYLRRRRQARPRQT